MRHHQRAAFAALYQSRSAHFPVCSSLISSGLRRFILRADRHFSHLLILTKDIHNRGHPGIGNKGIAVTTALVQILSTDLAKALAVLSA